MAPKFEEILGEGNVMIEDMDFIYGVDDYSFFQSVAPGIEWMLSVAPDEEAEGAERPGLHTSKLIVNERGLLNGVKIFASFPFKYEKK